MRACSATVLTTLAVCIGANVAIFSVVHSVLLEPLPFPEPEELVTVFNSYPGAGAGRAGAGTVDFVQRRAEVGAFEELALYRSFGYTVGETGATERVSALQVTPSFFGVLGVEAALGRTFTEAEMEEGQHRVVVLTHGYWQEHFAGAVGAVGGDLRVDGQPYRVVGVLPEDVQLPDATGSRILTPVPFGAGDRDLINWHSNNFEMIARLADGATVARAQAQIDALNRRLAEAWPVPNGAQLLADAGFSTQVVEMGPDLVRAVRPVLYLLWGGVGFVFLIGCVNLANLMLARAQTRTGEVATKLALGAPRTRIGAQVLTEAIVMALVGGAMGLFVGWAGLELLLGLGIGELPRGIAIGLDAPVLAFTLALAVGAGVLFGAIPMVQVMRGDLSPVFRTGRTGTASRRAVLLRNGLVTGQVAMAFVLLIGAGLMYLSLREALSVDPGFDPEGVLTGYVSLPESRYPDDGAQRRFWDRLLGELDALPAVETAGFTTALPFSGSRPNSVVTPEGYVPRPGESLLSPLQSIVGTGYFETMGIELREGRTFQRSDDSDAPRAMVIDEWLARRYWPEGGALGRRMVWGAFPGQDSVPESALWTIVGVVEQIKHDDLTRPAGEHVGAYYTHQAQLAPASVALTVRARAGEPVSLAPAVRGTLAALDPELPLFGVESMESRIDRSLTTRRVPLFLLGVFAVVALFLAVVGIYGALAYSVNQRTREIGIRMAMGSEPGRVFRDVVIRGLVVAGLGLGIGVGVAFALGGVVRSLLFGVEAADPRVMLAVGGLLMVAALAACILPAWRATAVDAVSVLGD